MAPLPSHLCFMHVSPPAPSPCPGWVSSELGSLDSLGLLREPFSILSRRPGSLQLPSGSLLDFTSNDYLALSHHQACILAAQKTVSDLGCGSGASRIVTGHSSIHHHLETALSTWLRFPSALLFPSGYQANLGCVTALLRPGDLVFSDAHNHASLVDGCRLARARISIYPHLDVSSLSSALSTAPSGSRRLVITESLFSMDGTIAPLSAISSLCKQHDALLLVDEAHAIGIMGPGGRGLSAEAGIRPDLLVGTLSKALGNHGAFVCAEPSLIQFLCNRARSLIYSTALPPATAGAAIAAVSLLQTAEGEVLRQDLQRLSRFLHHLLKELGIPASGQGSPIASLFFDSARHATLVKERLLTHGLLAWAFRPPSVPASTSRLRISLSAAHREEDILLLAKHLPPALSTCAPTQASCGAMPP